MECPHGSDAARMGQFGYDRRDMGVDIVEMDNVGSEIVEQRREFAANFARSERTRQRHQACHVLREVLLPWGRKVFGIVHGEDRHFVAPVAKHLLEIEGIYAVASATIVEFVGYQYLHLR